MKFNIGQRRYGRAEYVAAKNVVFY